MLDKEVGTKFCKKCRIEKPLSDFRLVKQQRGRYCYPDTYCKSCRREINGKRLKIRYETKGRQEFKEWYSDPENKENRRKYNQEYHQKNSERLKEYRKTRKDEDRKNVRKWQNTQHKINPKFKLRSKISSAVNRMLHKCNGSKKNNSVLKYLPYTIEELKIHIEVQFESWMNWQNHGNYNPKIWDDNDSSTWTWQLDHIIPQCKLPYNSMEHPNFRKCWDLSNLRPLAAKKNVISGCRIPRSESKICRHK